MNKKILVSDLDGTLLTDDKKISLNNKLAIKRFKEAGNYFVINTGRPYYRTKFLLEELDMLNKDDYCICFNGGLILNGKGEELFSYTLKNEDVELLVDLSDELSCGVLVYFSDHIEYDYLTLSTKFLEKLACTKENKEGKLSLRKSKNIYKILYIGELDDIERIKRDIPKYYYDNYNIVQSGPYWIEIMPKIIDKGFGLKKISELLKIDYNNTYSIGDEENDIAMLKTSKTSFVVDNARTIVKEYGDIIVKNNNEDGVKEAIDLILKGEI